MVVFCSSEEKGQGKWDQWQILTVPCPRHAGQIADMEPGAKKGTTWQRTDLSNILAWYFTTNRDANHIFVMGLIIGAPADGREGHNIAAG